MLVRYLTNRLVLNLRPHSKPSHKHSSVGIIVWNMHSVACFGQNIIPKHMYTHTYIYNYIHIRLCKQSWIILGWLPWIFTITSFRKSRSMPQLSASTILCQTTVAEPPLALRWTWSCCQRRTPGSRPVRWLCHSAQCAEDRKGPQRFSVLDCLWSTFFALFWRLSSDPQHWKRQEMDANWAMPVSKPAVRLEWTCRRPVRSLQSAQIGSTTLFLLVETHSRCWIHISLVQPPTFDDRAFHFLGLSIKSSTVWGCLGCKHKFLDVINRIK